MKKIYLIAILVFSLQPLTTIASTIIPAGNVSGIWTLAGSPYLVQGAIQIPTDSTLIIQPGVIVNFQGTYKLNVQGRLLAVGTITDSITFTAANISTGWRGIRFDNTPTTNDTSRIIYCKLQYGKATGTSSPNNLGGALYFSNVSKAVISHCSIINCLANMFGGGIYFHGSILSTTCNPIISYNLIANDSASSGGGLCCDMYSNPSILNNYISNNKALSGGGIYCYYANPNIFNNTITNNTSGGGIYSLSNAIISNNTISNNTATNGGGISCTRTEIVSNNIISGNIATYGGGIYTGGLDHPSINKNIISNNTALDGGGIYFNSGTTVIVSDNLICNNSASGNGGAFLCKMTSIPSINNSTIVNNSANLGGALYFDDPSSPNFRNCIIYGNTAITSGQQLYLLDETIHPNFYFCDIQGGSAAFEIGGNPFNGIYLNNINVNPLFVSPSSGSGTSYNGLSANWSLQNTSLCIDAGDPNGTYSPTDLIENPRINVCRIDMGAYEYQAGVPFNVSLGISQPILCNETTTGEIIATVTGSTPPYTYLWSNGQTTDTISGLSAGDYSVTVSTAINGCTIIKSITLTQPESFSISAGLDKTITCSNPVQLNANPNWLTIPVSTTSILYSVYFTDPNTGYIVGDGGTFMKTTNGGSNWTNQSIAPVMLYSIYFTDANTGYTVGDGGIILKTVNSGTSWTSQTSTSYSLHSVYFANTNVGYIAGGHGTILKTTNGGTSWTAQSSGTNYDLYAVHFADANTGYVVGDNGNILKTSNGGTNWTALTGGGTNQLRSTYFLDASTGYVVGHNGTILKTTNGGTNWTAQTGGINFYLNSVYFLNANTGYIASSTSGDIFYTSNSGTNWTPQVNGTLIGFNSVYFPDANTGYAVGYGYDNGYYGLVMKFPGVVTYSWSPTNGLNNPNIANPIANPSDTTTYIVTATSENGCIARDTITVFVIPLTANAGWDKTIVCGGSAQLDNTTSSYTGTGTLSYHWQPSTGLNYDTISNPITSAISNTNYAVTITTPTGCIARDSVMVSVNPLVVEAGMNQNLICGGSAQLHYTTSNYTGGGTLLYHWLPTAGLNYDSIPNPLATVINNQTYTVTVNTPNGCTATDNVTVYVGALTINATDATILCGDSATLNTSTNYTGTNLLTYEWLPAIGLIDTTVANPITTVNANQTYTVSISTPNGCTASTQLHVSLIPMNAPEICVVGVDSSNKNRVVWNKPLSAAIDSFYMYRETNITNIYQKIGSVAYDSMSVFVDTNSYPDVQSNKYQISIKDDCMMESDKSSPHKTMHLSINQGMGTTWNLIWDAYEGFTVSTYNVYRGPDTHNLQLIGTSSGSNSSYSDLNAPAGYLYYQVEVVSPNFCNPTKSYNSSRSNISTNKPSAINENGFESNLFSIRPNPAKDKIGISVAQKSNIEILSTTGQILRRIYGIEKHTDIDISTFADGIYFVKVITEKETAVKKFIKQ